MLFKRNLLYAEGERAQATLPDLPILLSFPFRFCLNLSRGFPIRLNRLRGQEELLAPARLLHINSLALQLFKSFAVSSLETTVMTLFELIFFLLWAAGGIYGCYLGWINFGFWGAVIGLFAGIASGMFSAFILFFLIAGIFLISEKGEKKK